MYAATLLGVTLLVALPAPKMRTESDPKSWVGKTVIVIDDGLATGSTMRAAIQALRGRGAERVVVAVPTGSPDVCEEFETEADDVICAATPEPFHSVGLWYDDFSQTTDDEVRDLLERARRGRAGAEEPRR